MVKRFVIAVLSVGLLTGAFAATAPPSVSDDAGPPVISERLLSTSGKALDRAPVRLLWDEGGKLNELRELARSTTDSSGAALLSWRPSKGDLAIAAANGNWFNFDVIVGKGASVGWITVPRKWTGAGWVADGGGVAGRLSGTLVLKMGDMRVGPAEYARKASSKANSYLGWTKVANVPSGLDARTTFTYGTKADSSVEVMANDGSGWYSAGFSKVSNVEAAVHGQVSSNRTRQMSVQLRYVKRTTCAGGWICHTRLSATEWTGAIRDAGITNWACNRGQRHTTLRYPRWQGITKNRGVNRTYDGAVRVAGLTLAARSGYSNSVRMQVDFRIRGGVSHRTFCIGGSNTYWPQARTIYVSSWG